MRRLRGKAIILIFAGVCFEAASAGGATGIEWEPDLGKALTRASQEKKWVLAKFYTEQCPYCVKMEREVFSRPEVIQMVSKFVPAAVNAEKEPKIAERYRVDGYPTNLVLDAEGQVLEIVSGYVPAGRFLQAMAPLAEGRNPVEALEKEAAEEPESATTQLRVGYRLFERQRYDRSRPYLEKGYRLAADAEMREEALRLVVASFLYAEDPAGAAGRIDEYRKQFPESTYLGPMYLDLGRMNYEREEYELAVANLTNAKELAEDFTLRVRANWLLGAAKEKLAGKEGE